MNEQDRLKRLLAENTRLKQDLACEQLARIRTEERVVSLLREAASFGEEALKARTDKVLQREEYFKLCEIIEQLRRRLKECSNAFQCVSCETRNNDEPVLCEFHQKIESVLDWSAQGDWLPPEEVQQLRHEIADLRALVDTGICSWGDHDEAVAARQERDEAYALLHRLIEVAEDEHGGGFEGCEMCTVVIEARERLAEAPND